MLDFFLGALIEDPAARGRVWPPVDEAFWPSQVSSGSTEMLDAAARLVATRYSDGEPPVVEELEELLAVASEAGAASGKILRAVREAFVAVKRDFTADIEAQRDEVPALVGCTSSARKGTNLVGSIIRFANPLVSRAPSLSTMIPPLSRTASWAGRAARRPRG